MATMRKRDIAPLTAAKARSARSAGTGGVLPVRPVGGGVERGRAPGARQAGRGAEVATSTRVAVLVGPGDRVGHRGRWRTVRAARTDIGATGSLFVVVTWEDGGTGRFRAGDELLLARPRG
ncbi:hypothetical protein ACFV3R_22690 [Streptomyces sp. NPDC059740]|uniref:hypothetical protein n=1 Tax=Streptomyces sp. NPDC059740 TaxID=3346926 RepID=UPI00364CD1FA